jgi:hypothetical protein
MDIGPFSDTIQAWTALPLRLRILALAALVFVFELALRRFAPKSRAYARWTGFFLAVGSVWTAVLLALVYALSVGPTGLAMRLFGHDPLDRWRPGAEPTFWRPCEPNPLGASAAARHQF